MVSLTDRPDMTLDIYRGRMTLDVYRGRKTTIQQQFYIGPTFKNVVSSFACHSVYSVKKCPVTLRLRFLPMLCFRNHYRHAIVLSTHLRDIQPHGHKFWNSPCIFILGHPVQIQIFPSPVLVLLF